MAAMAERPSPEYDVVGLGCCCWDLVGIVEHYPGPDDKQPLLELIQQGGGLVATATVTVTRLGGKACFIGRVGDDEWGAKTRQSLVAEGVSVAGLQVMEGHTSQVAICIAHGTGGQRTIMYKYGSWPLMEAGDVPRRLVVSGKVLLLDLHHPRAALQAARWAQQAGIPTVVDIERPGPHVDELLALADYPVVPERFACRYGGSDDLGLAARRFLDLHPRALVVTQGERGCTAFVDDQVIYQPAFPVQPLVDTTGAGDVFHGAFAYGLALGYDLPYNLRFAAAVAALKCRKLGGRAGIPTMNEVLRLLDGT